MTSFEARFAEQPTNYTRSNNTTLMSHPEDTEYGRCEATAKSTGNQCGRAAVGEHGKCDMHGPNDNGGAPEGNDNAVANDGGAPENNDNAERHGMRSDPGPYYHRQPDAEQDRIDEWAASWARRSDYGELGFEKVFQTNAIKLHQIESGDEYIAEEGAVVSRLVGRTENGEPIIENEENPAFLYQGRAMKDIIRFLKEFGCLDDPDSQQAEAAQSVAEILGGSQ